MDILSDEQYQVLGFVGACNRNFHNPTATEIMLWRDNPDPLEAVYRSVRREAGQSAMLPFLESSTASTRMFSSMFDEVLRPLQRALALNLSGVTGAAGRTTTTTTTRELVKSAETLVQHLIRLTWIAEVATPDDENPGLRLTDLGRALLRDVELDSENEQDVGVVVLGRDDPLAYPTLVGQLAAAGEGLLVDPFLKLSDLHTLVNSTQLTRLLVSGKPNNRGEVGAMRAYLDSSSLGRRLEVRSSVELHDRVLLADDGDVVTLGTSLNGVGRTTTVLTPIPGSARQALQAEYKRLWSEGTLVGPPPIESDDAEPDDAEPDDKDYTA